MTVEEWNFSRPVQKIAIIGNGGGGKSTLARRLGQELNLPVYSVDDYAWQPGWQPTSSEDMSGIHGDWLSQPGWVIDGWGSWDLIEQRFDDADLVVFVDFPLSLHYRWAIKRQVQAALGLSPGWPPPGCRASTITFRLMKTLWAVHKELRPRLVRMTSEEPLNLRTVVVKSPVELGCLRAGFGEAS
jgi:GTPase SAR1 family protein